MHGTKTKSTNTTLMQKETGLCGNKWRWKSL